jgi:hypothetical protein
MNEKKTPPKEENRMLVAAEALLLLLAILLVGIGATRLFGLLGTADEIALEYLGAAAAAIVLLQLMPLFRYIKSIQWRDIKVEFQQKLDQIDRKIEQEVKPQLEEIGSRAYRAQSLADRAQTLAIGQGGKRPPKQGAEVEFKSAEPTVSEDPQKGKWGGTAVSSDRRLEAEIVPMPGTEARYQVTLRVVSTRVNAPLAGSVQFHLHPTFSNPNPIVPVEDGIASLTLVAWGAFTVGAEADNGQTRLELDLADVPGASRQFYEL